MCELLYRCTAAPQGYDIGQKVLYIPHFPVHRDPDLWCVCLHFLFVSKSTRVGAAHQWERELPALTGSHAKHCKLSFQTSLFPQGP